MPRETIRTYKERSFTSLFDGQISSSKEKDSDAFCILHLHRTRRAGHQSRRDESDLLKCPRMITSGSLPARPAFRYTCTKLRVHPIAHESYDHQQLSAPGYSLIRVLCWTAI